MCGNQTSTQLSQSRLRPETTSTSLGLGKIVCRKWIREDWYRRQKHVQRSGYTYASAPLMSAARTLVTAVHQYLLTVGACGDSWLLVLFTETRKD